MLRFLTILIDNKTFPIPHSQFAPLALFASFARTHSQFLIRAFGAHATLCSLW